MNCAILPYVQSQIPAVTGIALVYPQVADLEHWGIPEGTVPQATYHDQAAGHLQALLEEFIRRQGRTAYVARDLAIRYLEDQPRVGIDPDVCVLDPPPPDVMELTSLCLWKPGHLRPPLCIEIVSQTHPNKDYGSIHERYAFMHAAEVVVFDPILAGPRVNGGPVPLQLWRRSESGLLTRVGFGSEPAYCEYLGAWFVPEGRLLQIADDRGGQLRWPTAEERERAEKDAALAALEKERAARVVLERRILELERR